eukprot:8962609-Pyramimonas_sp.AAC.1
MVEGATRTFASTTPVVNTLVVIQQSSLSPVAPSNQGTQDMAMVGGPGVRELFALATFATVTSGAGWPTHQ